MKQHVFLILCLLGLGILNLQAQDKGRLPVFNPEEGKPLVFVSRKVNSDFSYHTTIVRTGTKLNMSTTLEAAKPEDEVRTYWLISDASYRQENGQIHFEVKESDASPTGFPHLFGTTGISMHTLPESVTLILYMPNKQDNLQLSVACTQTENKACKPQLVLDPTNGTYYTKCTNTSCTTNVSTADEESINKAQAPMFVLNSYDLES